MRTEQELGYEILLKTETYSTSPRKAIVTLEKNANNLRLFWLGEVPSLQVTGDARLPEAPIAHSCYLGGHGVCHCLGCSKSFVIQIWIAFKNAGLS